MSESFTRLTDITSFKQLWLRPDKSRPGYIDCPEVIRQAFYGKPPAPSMMAFGQQLRFVLGFTLAVVPLEFLMLGFVPGMTTAMRLLICGVALVIAPVYCLWDSLKDEKREYAKGKALFDAFSSDPDLYRDEIFKAAVNKLSRLDFQGRHVPINEAKIGRYEREVIDWLGKLGIHQEFSVENRGRPYLIHQYEMKELKRGRWENGDLKNYVLDIAILWPERRIKYNIEIDDPSHNQHDRREKDIRRDAQLTARGWFVRRLNHNFFAYGRGEEAIKEIVSIVYFFAKYANDEPFGWDAKLIAWIQQRRFDGEQKLALASRSQTQAEIVGAP